MAAAAMASGGATGGGAAGRNRETFTRNEKLQDTRHQNITAAKAVANAVRTSLGPRGLDKLISTSRGETVITNDGATILAQLQVAHPCARLLVELSRAQDVAAGDGTTSVVVIAGALLTVAERLLDRGVHAQAIAGGFLAAAARASEVLREMAEFVSLADRQRLTEAAVTSLGSKVVSADAAVLAPIAVDAVMRVVPEEYVEKMTKERFEAGGAAGGAAAAAASGAASGASSGAGSGAAGAAAGASAAASAAAPAPPVINLKEDIRVVKKLGDTVESTELVEGIIFADQRVTKVAGGPTRVTDAKVGLIQFCLSAPKTDMENSIVVQDYAAMDRLAREERLIAARAVKQIAATGCNVLLIQKSILRDAVSTLALDYLAKKNILVVQDVERDDVDFVSRALECEPVASLDFFTAEKLGRAALVTDELTGAGGRIVRISGVPGRRTVTVLCRSSNALMLDEVERSLHDALCVVRSLVLCPALLPGGGAPETELSVRLAEFARTLPGTDGLCVRAFAEALECVPFILAENCGHAPIELVTELRRRHAAGERRLGIDVRRGAVLADMAAERVVQPLLNSLSAVRLATETVVMILKIDDIVITR